jgi:acetylornithine/N-succinyldiaminopimelate aminotransferase
MPPSGNDDVARRTRAAMVGNYAQQPVALARGEGSLVWDVDGRRYVDLTGGIAVTALGHCHPRVVAALEAQARRVWHVSNHFFQEPQVALAERLVRLSFADRVFLSNSGGEANEAAFKLARRYHRARGDDRFEFVAFERGFHGRSLFTVGMTGTPAYWQGFEPLVPGIRHAPYGDLDAVKALLSPRTAAIVVEPLQGEGGVRPAPPGFLAGLRALADENGCLLVFDEIQTGMGRTGTLFAYQGAGVVPDVMTLAKALGNGIPIGAMLTTESIAAALVPGTHGSTFGGNPLAAACACAVLDELTDGGVIERSRETGRHLGERLAELAQRLGPERVVEARGAGLLRGIQLPGPAAGAIARCREQGALVLPAGPDVVRIAPALNIPRDVLDLGLAALERALSA